MSTSLYDLSVGSYLQIVEAAANVMRKGAAYCSEQGIDTAQMVGTALREDMAPLHFQAVCVAHHSLGAIKGIKAGEFAPPSGYGEMDYAGLQGLLDSTLAELQAQQVEEINALAGGRLVFKLGGNEIPFTAENFVLSFSLPNFYFHAATLYDILRHKGVPLGKRDFLGALKMG